MCQAPKKGTGKNAMNKTPAVLISFLLIFLAGFQGFSATSQVATYKGLVRAIRETRNASQARIEAVARQEKVREAWETGRLIQEHVLQHKERAEYCKQVIIKLAKDLDTSETELKYMVEFAREYPIRPTSGELSWGHYRDLLAVNDPEKRKEVERFAEDNNLAVTELRKEIKRRGLTAPEELSTKLPEITPGPLNTYPIIRLKDRLKIDLGFGVYLDLPEKEAKKFKEGGIVRVDAKNRGQATGASGSRNLSPVFARKDGQTKNSKDATEPQLFTYAAVATQTVDGDTFHALIDLGFGITMAQRVRLRRIDAAEIVTAEGKEARGLLDKILFRDHGRILLQSRELDQHGRPIADVWVKGQPVDQELLDR